MLLIAAFQLHHFISTSFLDTECAMVCQALVLAYNEI